MDRKLIGLLRRDARRSVSDLALELGLSRATVRARMERLEERGDVVGYTAVLRSEAVEMPIRGVTLIQVEGRATQRVIDQLGGFTEVQAIHMTNGKWDLVAEIATESLSALDAVLGRLRLLPGVTNSETNLLLATPRSTRARLPGREAGSV
jgi:DNA-binding Lrp family transcriptional regulator